MEAFIIGCFLVLVVLPIVVQLINHELGALEQYVKTFSLSEEREALKQVKFYKEN